MPNDPTVPPAPSATNPVPGTTDPAPATGPTPGAPAAGDGQTPPWGNDFDAEKAWNLVQNLRGDKDNLKARLDERQQQLDDAKPLLEQAEAIRKGNLTDVQALQEQLDATKTSADAATETASSWRAVAVSAKAEALAAPKFADAAVGVQLLGDLTNFVDGDTIDDTKLSAALDELLEKHPYLARSGDGQQQRMTPNPAQGAGAAPLPIDDQIKAAQDRGDIESVIQLKHQKYQQQQR